MYQPCQNRAAVAEKVRNERLEYDESAYLPSALAFFAVAVPTARLVTARAATADESSALMAKVLE
jgi:hypothetical protein